MCYYLRCVRNGEDEFASYVGPFETKKQTDDFLEKVRQIHGGEQDHVRWSYIGPEFATSPDAQLIHEKELAGI